MLTINFYKMFTPTPLTDHTYTICIGEFHFNTEPPTYELCRTFPHVEDGFGITGSLEGLENYTTIKKDYTLMDYLLEISEQQPYRTVYLEDKLQIEHVKRTIKLAQDFSNISKQDLQQ